MKKLSLLSIVVLMSFSLAACSSNNSSESASSSNSTTVKSSVEKSSETTSTEQTTPYPTSSYKTAPIDASIPNGNSYKITNISKSTSSLDGSEILLVEMDFTNNGTSPTSPYLAFVVDWDVQQTDGTITKNLNGANGAMANVENQEAVSLGDTQVNPGATVHAIIGYKLEDPKGDVGFIIRTTQITGNPQGFAWANN